MDIEKYLETFDDASVIHEIRTFIKEDGETGQELSLEIYSANDHFADLAARLWREGYERFDAQKNQPSATNSPPKQWLTWKIWNAMYDLSNIEMVIINNLKETDPIKEFYRKRNQAVSGITQIRNGNRKVLGNGKVRV